jgi:hypothetical protein
MQSEALARRRGPDTNIEGLMSVACSISIPDKNQPQTAEDMKRTPPMENSVSLLSIRYVSVMILYLHRRRETSVSRYSKRRISLPTS